MTQGHTSIWFFIGLLLAVYGILILGSGLYELSAPAGRTVVLAELHAAIWWGALLLALGCLYTWRFSPRRQRSGDKGTRRSK